MSDNNENALTSAQTRPSLPSTTTPSASSPITTDVVKSDVQANLTEHCRAVTAEDVDLGHALRAIYQQTVEENIPDEMLELLKHLN